MDGTVFETDVEPEPEVEFVGDADRIVFVKGGALAAQGTYAELEAASEDFRDMMQGVAQAGGAGGHASDNDGDGGGAGEQGDDAATATGNGEEAKAADADGASKGEAAAALKASSKASAIRPHCSCV